jgi:phage shock protein C
MDQVKKLYKSRQNNVVDGVCGGVAEYFNVDVTIVRVIWAVTLLLHGLGLFVYILAMIFVPVNPEHEIKAGGNRNRNYGLIGGCILIFAGIMIISDGHSWFNIFHFSGFYWPIRFGRQFWPLLLILGGIIYIVMTLKKNNVEPEINEINDPGSPKLTRNSSNKWFGGVCSGFADYFKIDPVFVRIGLVAVALLTHVLPLIVIYIVLMFVIPEED